MLQPHTSFLAMLLLLQTLSFPSIANTATNYSAEAEAEAEKFIPDDQAFTFGGQFIEKKRITMNWGNAEVYYRYPKRFKEKK